MAYLDYAGAGVPSKRLLAEVGLQLQSLQLANPHSHHPASIATRQIIEEVRLRILHFFNADDYEVIFTANSTAALHTVGECFQFSSANKRPENIETKLPESGGPSFGHLSDSHNSVVGMRDQVRERVEHVACVNFDETDWDNVPQTSSGLFAFTAMSNFCGRKYPLETIAKLKAKGWAVLVDAAAYACCNEIDLSKYNPDFVALSFYKLFGYPTGIGALLVKKSSQHLLTKRHFSGGTVAMMDPYSFNVKQKERLADRFEDGTCDYYGIAAILKAIEEFESAGGIREVFTTTERLTRLALNTLKDKYYWNGKPLVEMYRRQHCEYGPIIAFNLKRDDGSYVGYTEVAKMCELFGVQMRTGCFCNIGACMEHLQLTPEDLYANHLSGKECGDEMDVINGKPAGACRISFGRFSTEKDIQLFESVLDCCFLKASHEAFEVLSSIPLNTFTPTISQIFYYPVKSLNGISSKKKSLGPTGFLHDRQFMIQSCGITLTLKRFPRLCGLRAAVKGESLLLSGQDDELKITVPFTTMERHQKSIVCVNSVGTVDCGEKVGAWLDDALGLHACRLMRVENDAERSLTNDSPFLLINEASVQIIAEAVDISRDELILRFRPNLVLKGLPAFVEDGAKTVTINGLLFEVVGKCTRCEMICVDPHTGDKDPAVIVALRDFRYRDKMTFGIYLRQVEINGTQYISEGDNVQLC